MAETGFGSLSYDPLPEYNDWGFGSPTPVVLSSGAERQINLERDTAFGSPFDNFRYPIEIQGEGDLIPDDGGVILKVNSRWYLTWDFEAFNSPPKRQGRVGPFRCKFISQADGFAYDAVGDRRLNCFTNFGQTVLYVGVPPLPRGQYDMQIQWQLNTVIISDAIEVGCRPRIPEAYHIRKHVPSHLMRGPAVIQNDKIEVYKKEPILSLLLKSIGEALQEMSGRPTTGVAQKIYWGDATINVESTIGFPDSGELYVAGILMKYTGRTASTFTGVTHPAYFSGDIAIRQEVTCNVAALK